MKREEIFRNTKSWYTHLNNYTSSNLINFALNNSGKNILDIGCATGEYCQKLNSHGFKCIGIDNNPKYIKKANESGLEAYVMDGTSLEFPDNSFDTIIIFEVLEHVKDPEGILKEAKRVARKNILVTVPNSTGVSTLGKFGLTYDHMLDEDHINFFTKSDLEQMLKKYFKEFEVKELEPMVVCITNPWWLKFLFLLFYKLKISKSSVYYRLYATIEVE
jgi:ubiquinone/menaquinone biosynthesis C-methylase UbiE